MTDYQLAFFMFLIAVGFVFVADLFAIGALLVKSSSVDDDDVAKEWFSGEGDYTFTKGEKR